MTARARQSRGRQPTGVAAARARRESRRTRFHPDEVKADVRIEQPEIAEDGLIPSLLAKKNASLARISELRAEMEKEIAAIKAVDDVIKLCDPHHDLAKTAVGTTGKTAPKKSAAAR